MFATEIFKMWNYAFFGDDLTLLRHFQSVKLGNVLLQYTYLRSEHCVCEVEKRCKRSKR